MNRVVEPEILDELKPDDPRAVRARRDLRRINFWMGNARVIAAALKGAFGGHLPKQIVELGAGDGTLLLRVAAKFKQQQTVQVTFVDREPAIQQSTIKEYEKLGWKITVVASDVFEWMKTNGGSECILANLFLHHFSEEQLRGLFVEATRRTSCLIACEPPRSRHALFSCKLMPLIGIGEVALYDAAVSIRAGFRGTELSCLWPQTAGWQLREGSAGLFSHLFVARKI